MSGLAAALAEHGERLIALNVFLQQSGLPLPAEPTLVVAGSLVARGRLSLPGVITAALTATLVADLAWFAVGKRYGARALRLIAHLSSSPGKRLGQIDRLLARCGPAAFALAKFIPGFPMVGPVLAGSLGASLRAFVFYDVLAMALWASAFTGLGVVFHRHVELALKALERVGGWGLILGAAVVAGVALRLWYKARAASAASAAAARAARDVGSAVGLRGRGPSSLHA